MLWPCEIPANMMISMATHRVQTMTHHHSEGISGILTSANIYEIQMVTLQKAFRSGSRKAHLKLKQYQTDN